MITVIRLFLLILISVVIQGSLPAEVKATVISSFPYEMTSEPDFNSNCDHVAGACGCSYVWQPNDGWSGNGSFRVNPPNLCRGNGQYCGIGTYDFPNSEDIYVRYLVRLSSNWLANAMDCGYNKQVKSIISQPETRAMLILQDWCGPWDGYNYAPCENTSCNYRCTNRFSSTDYHEEWVSIEFHMDGNDNELELFITTPDGVFTANESQPYSSTNANIGSPIDYIEGIMLFFNGYFQSGTWYEISDVVIDTSYIGPPSGFVGGSPTYECSDTIDNDGDGQTDYPNDPGCSSTNDNDEYGTNQCDDGVDNDGDGQTDLADGGCSSLSDSDESNCGDAVCEGGETCSSCTSDCSVGVGQICCSGSIYVGDCCSDASCSGSQTCQSNMCVAPTCENDADGDGYGTGQSCAGTDCDDNNASVHSLISCIYDENSCGNYNLCRLSCPTPPSEICGNGIDEDCDGSDLICSLSSYCGDGSCDNSESCSSCSTDCGACPSSGGGGSENTAPSQITPPANSPTVVGTEFLTGTLVKASNHPAIYYLSQNGQRYVFPNQKCYQTWYADFSQVKLINSADLAKYPVVGNMTYRSGTRLVKITTDPTVYAVEPGGILRSIVSEENARLLYGDKWNQMIDDVPDSFFVNYTLSEPLITGKHPVGTLIKYPQSSTIYYIDENYKQRLILNQEAFEANYFEWGDILEVEEQISYENGEAVMEQEDGLMII